MRSSARYTAWVKRNPLMLFLPVQALLLFSDLDLLPIWGDEHATIVWSTRSLAEMVALLRGEVHPPFYYVICHYWLTVPWWGSTVVQLRALSVIFALLSLVVVYRLWVRLLDPWSRWWFCALWTLSPCVLLYARMARNYSLQQLLSCAALYCAWNLMRAPHRWRFVFSYAAVAAVLLYVHYLPAAAIMAASALGLLWRLLRERDPALLAPLIVPLLLVGIAHAAWLPELGSAMARVARADHYSLMPSYFLETATKAVYTFVSFSFGEMLPPWVAGLALLLVPAVLALLWTALTAPPGWLQLLLPAALIGFAGASQWVSYAFVAARLFFLFPFYLLLLLHGARKRRTLGTIACGGLLCVSLLSDASYFRQDGFLNKGYLIPFDRIAAHIARRSGAEEATVLLDEFGTNPQPIMPLLPAGMRVIRLLDPAAAREVRAAMLRKDGRTIWLVRSTRDVSPGGWIGALEAEVSQGYEVRCHLFLPYSAMDHLMMRLAGWPEQPSHVIALVEMHRKERRAGP